MKMPFHAGHPVKMTALFLALATLSLSARALEVSQPPAPDESAAPAGDPAKPLGELVGKLSALDTLTPRDLADFATETIAYSQAVQGARQQVSEKPIRDALAAVAQGRKLDPKAADWDDLQSRLEKFLEKPDRQKQDQQQQQQDKNQQDDRQQNQQEQQQQQQDSQSGQNDRQQQQQDNQQNQSGENKDVENRDGQQQQGRENSQDPQAGDQRQSQQQQDSRDEKDDKGGDSGNTDGQPAKPQQQEAFGDMQKKDGGKDDAQQQNAGLREQQNQQQPEPRPAQTDDMRQVGGADGKNQQSVDSRMIVPMQKLEQVRDKDSPALLFQRMQAAQDGQRRQTGSPQAPKGRDW